MSSPAPRALVVDPLLTPADVATSLAVSRSMAYTLLKRGLLRAIYIGRLPRVRRSELDRYLASLEGAL